MQCAERRKIGETWITLSIVGEELGLLHEEVGEGSIHYFDGSFKRHPHLDAWVPLVSLCCTDGLPLVFEKEHIITIIPMLSSWIDRGEMEILIPFSQSAVQRTIEELSSSMPLECNLDKDVVGYLFPGEKFYLEMEPTRERAVEVARSNGMTLPLLGKHWFERTGTHNYHLYELVSHAFCMVMRAFTAYDSLTVDELNSVTIGTLTREECDFLRLQWLSGDVGEGIIAIVRSVISESTRMEAQRYYDWITKTWPTREKQWANKSLVLQNMNDWQKREVNLLKRITSRPE